MFGRKHPKIDWSFSKRRHDFSNTSSASISPTVPELESPVTFQAMTTKNSPNATLRQREKADKTAAMPSMFLEEKDDDEPEIPNLTRGVPSDARPVYVAHKQVEEEQTTRTKTQHYEDAFNTRGPCDSASIRVSQLSIVVVEIKMNSKIKEDESKLISDITSRLAQIYQRPESSMLITIQHDACINFGNSSLPAYLTKIFALPSLIGPVTNLRNTILIQSALEDVIRIASNRGVVLYIPVPEENFATNGVTLMGEVVRLEQRSYNEEPGILKTLSRTMSRRRRLKSSSGSSAPLSLATASSWAQEGGTQGSDSAKGKESLSGRTSCDESEPHSVRKSRSLRHFVSHRLSELGTVGETQ